tara:strand:+ start:1400 stop:2671 length:1272 start_codon:yes stop_codon:yes gene_type:complete
MSILGRFLEIERRLGGGFQQPEEPMQELSADMDISSVLAGLDTNPAVLAAREARARRAALEDPEDLIINAGPPEDTTTVVTEPPTETGKKETSRSTIIKNGRLVLQIIYNDGTTDEIDLGPSDPGVSDPPPPAPVPGDPQEQFNAREFAQTNYSYLGEELLETFIGEYNANGGDVDEALRTMRSTQAYKDKFPGIFREDGTTLRFTTETPELDYIKMKEDYFNALEDYNLNPSYFEDKITDLFDNDVSPDTFATRLDTAYTSLFNQFDAVKQYYVENYPGQFPTTDDISDEAIFASFISEDVSADIISQRVKVSQIGGAFKEEDFAVSAQQAQRLVSAGLSGTGAQQIAQRAEASLPRLQRLARRFTGREDIFGLSEFIESEVFGEGVAAQVRERLEAEQATVFTREGGAAQTQAGVTGLVEQ